MDQSKKKKYMFIAGPLVLFIALIGLTYAFFNYTRTGEANTISTGSIYFSADYGTAITLTNLFPMTSEEASNANLDTLTIGITGNTTYVDGEEYEISIVDAHNSVDGIRVPVAYTATYTPATGGTVGTSSNDYFNVREDKDASIYMLAEEGEIIEGKQILVGYVDNGATGVNGILTISAYIDASKVAISDTYPEGDKYIINPNMTTQELNVCLAFFSGVGGDAAFCQGTGTILGPDGLNITFQEALDKGFFYGYEGMLMQYNVIQFVATNGTTSEWVNGRTLFSTEQWNSLSNNPLSFKIKAESNEGIWVEEAGRIDSCQGCKFLYHVVNSDDPTEFINTTWNTGGLTPTVLTTGLYDSYFDVVEANGKNIFLGVKLNSSNQVTNAYTCGLKGGVPFCIEGTNGNATIYANNVSLLQSASIWNNTCNAYQGSDLEHGNFEVTMCGSSLYTTNAFSAYSMDLGYTAIGYNREACSINPSGLVGCVANNA